ncbi:MAG: IS110 family transposase [Solirubrobacterales bacterium]|nr:IS110 family transposase [Solirubrobacterales bacterium]MBV9338446.1 IS110 family transposase [Solirubrobacterales bacterium]
MSLLHWVGRAIGLDVHRDFCVIAICEDGVVRSAGRVPSTPEALQTLAESLLPSDRVALEVTGSCWEVARILEPHVNRVIVVSPDDTGITQARAKTDRLDARALAKLLWKGELEAVWKPDERCRVMRRRLARREQLVQARTRSKQEIHAVLHRRLQGKPPVSDLFGVKGREWLAGLKLPLEERESVDAGLRHVEFLEVEIAQVERLIAQQALDWPEIRRLMTVPGVSLICAASFMAAIGNANRFLTSRKLVAYLGLDPKVRQSGEAPARSGRISKRGSASARWVLVEAAWITVRQPGPLHAFYERTRARRGHGKAIVASARKLAVLFWCMLTRSEDYAHQQPSLTAKKLRQLELKAGPSKHTKAAAGVWSANRAVRHAERALAEQAEVSYKRMVQDQQAGAPARRVGASATLEHASK